MTAATVNFRGLTFLCDSQMVQLLGNCVIRCLLGPGVGVEGGTYIGTSSVQFGSSHGAAGKANNDDHTKFGEAAVMVNIQRFVARRSAEFGAQ